VKFLAAEGLLYRMLPKSTPASQAELMVSRNHCMPCQINTFLHKACSQAHGSERCDGLDFLVLGWCKTVHINHEKCMREDWQHPRNAQAGLNRCLVRNVAPAENCYPQRAICPSQHPSRYSKTSPDALRTPWRLFPLACRTTHHASTQRLTVRAFLVAYLSHFSAV
jgi:hypothetical protein